MQFTPAHEYAEIFPLHDDLEKLQPLIDDIKKVGQRNPIIRFEGKVLDGRRRERACFKAGKKPKYKDFKGTHAEALALVWSLNFPQRHLGEGERALCAARYATAEHGVNRFTLEEKKKMGQLDPSTFDEEKPRKTRKEAAEKFRVSETDVKRAKAVNEHGCEALQKAVADEVVSLSDAAKIAKVPHGIQVLAIEKVSSGECKSLVKAVEVIKAHKKATKAQSLCERCKIVGYEPECYQCAVIAEREAKVELPMTDSKGFDVPEELRTIFSVVPDFLNFNRTLTSCARLAKLIEGSKIFQKRPLDPKRAFTKFHLVFKKARLELAGFMPYKVCQGCVGKHCELCRGDGWISVEEDGARQKAAGM